MNKFLITSLSLLTLISCVDGRGTMTVNKQVVLNGKKGKVVYEEGDHKVAINYKKGVFSKKEKIELKSKGKKKVVVVLPETVKVPKYNGEITLTAQQAGQPYDIRGSVETDSYRSDNQTGRQSCSVSMSYERCVIVYSQGRRYRRYQPERETLFGSQRVSFYYHTEVKDQMFELLLPGSEEVVAKYDGGETKQTKYTTNKGPCRIDRNDLIRFRLMASRARRCGPY